MHYVTLCAVLIGVMFPAARGAGEGKRRSPDLTADGQSVGGLPLVVVRPGPFHDTTRRHHRRPVDRPSEGDRGCAEPRSGGPEELGFGRASSHLPRSEHGVLQGGRKADVERLSTPAAAVVLRASPDRATVRQRCGAVRAGLLPRRRCSSASRRTHVRVFVDTSTG